MSQENVEGSEAQAEASQREGAEGQPPSFVTALERIESAIRDSVRQESEGESERIAEQAHQDLEAQKEMARWAADMAIAGIFTALLTLAGLVLIGRTLYHTRKAAEHTQGMLEEAEKMTQIALEANKAAIEANESARDMVESQRAWMCFDDFQGEIRNGPGTISDFWGGRGYKVHPSNNTAH